MVETPPRWEEEGEQTSANKQMVRRRDRRGHGTHRPSPPGPGGSQEKVRQIKRLAKYVCLQV